MSETKRGGKKRKVDEAVSTKSDSVEHVRVNLGNERYAVVSTFNGQLKVHLRQYEVRPNGISYPTKTGVCFNPQRFASLIHHLPEIVESVNRMRDGNPVESLKSHIGGELYVTVQSGYQCVNFRHYFVPNGPYVVAEELPTRHGIALRLGEFDALIEQLDQIKRFVPPVPPCYVGVDHSDISVFLACKECNPFLDLLK